MASIVAILVALAVIVSVFAAQDTYADPLQNAFRQRIGNYDLEVATEPQRPVTGAPTKVMLRIAGVNGDDLVDTQVSIRVESSQGIELLRTNPIIVPAGHYEREFVFADVGRQVLYVDLDDYQYSGETLTFTFFVNVSSPNDFMFTLVPVVASAVVAAAIGIFFVKKRKKRLGAAGVQ